MYTSTHTEGTGFGKFILRLHKCVGCVAKHVDSWAVILCERRPWWWSVTLMWNVFGDRDRRDFLEGSHRILETEMAARRQGGAKVKVKKQACDCHCSSLTSFFCQIMAHLARLHISVFLFTLLFSTTDYRLWFQLEFGGNQATFLSKSDKINCLQQLNCEYLLVLHNSNLNIHICMVASLVKQKKQFEGVS